MDFFSNILTNIYGVLFRPSTAFAKLNKEYNSKLLSQALIVFVITELIAAQLSLVELIDSLFTWVFVAGLIFLTAYVFSSGVKFLKLLSLLAFANIPLLLMGPLSIIESQSSILSGLLELVLIIWSFNLGIIAVSTACDIDKKKTILLYSIPVIGVIYFILSSLTQLVIMF